jgi:hypothetical protein
MSSLQRRKSAILVIRLGTISTDLVALIAGFRGRRLDSVEFDFHYNSF